MFWYSLVGADRPPNKQAMPVARQEDLCRYSPFHVVKKWRCIFKRKS